MSLAKVDGRRTRTKLSRARIIDAALDLVMEGDLRPTRKSIAARAGLSLRSVHYQYRDRESLFAEAALHHLRRILPQLPELEMRGPLARRLDAYVERRTQYMEHMAPLRRSVVLLEPMSAQVRERLAQARSSNRAELKRIFREELASLGPNQARLLLSALTASAGFPSWESLRFHQALSFADAQQAVRYMLRAVLRLRGKS